ncbi:hypothetical protein GN956_G3702 [Arapaima gigas]
MELLLDAACLRERISSCVISVRYLWRRALVQWPGLWGSRAETPTEEADEQWEARRIYSWLDGHTEIRLRVKRGQSSEM